jgi:hypothetical protein
MSGTTTPTAAYSSMFNADGTPLTPEQQQQRRALLFAQQLMNSNTGAPQRSTLGGVAAAVNPIMGAAMMKYGMGNQPPAPVSSGTPGLAWNPNNPVGTSTLGGTTANNGWLANNMPGLFG